MTQVENIFMDLYLPPEESALFVLLKAKAIKKDKKRCRRCRSVKTLIFLFISDFFSGNTEQKHFMCSLKWGLCAWWCVMCLCYVIRA